MAPPASHRLVRSLAKSVQVFLHALGAIALTLSSTYCLPLPNASIKVKMGRARARAEKAELDLRLFWNIVIKWSKPNMFR